MPPTIHHQAIFMISLQDLSLPAKSNHRTEKIASLTYPLQIFNASTPIPTYC